MAEIRRGFGDRPGERLPWLEPVEDEEEETAQVGLGGLAALALMLLVVVGLLVAAFVLFSHWRASRAELGQIIHAPTTPYKEKPRNPGGLNVDGSNVVAQRTGAGADIDAPLDLTAIPEEPVTGPGSAAPAAAAPPSPAPAPAPAPRNAPPPAPTPKPQASAEPAPTPAAPPAAVAPARAAARAPSASSAGGGTIQLGAFSSEAKANAAWKALSGRFHVLDGMTMAISAVTTGDTILYRLRASGGGSPAQACAALKVAGESCAVIG